MRSVSPLSLFLFSLTQRPSRRFFPGVTAEVMNNPYHLWSGT
jgi:hypothetical protein